jgi:LysM repeat protein
VSLSQIKTWNKLSSTKILKGQKLAIKTTERKKVIKTVDVPAASTPVAKYNADDNMTLTPEESKHMPSNGIKYALHTVQKGETLSTITGLYAGSSEDGIKQLNNLASSELKVGATIKIPLQ